jgi:hypothetical protein
VTPWVLTGNTRARTLYEAMSWNHDGTAREYLGWGIKVPEVRYARCAKAGKKVQRTPHPGTSLEPPRRGTAWVISAPGSRTGRPHRGIPRPDRTQP